MSTPAQIAANQANAQLSTGPNTPEGQATVSGNALRHGLTSARTVIPGESQEHYDAFHAGLMKDFSPGSVLEVEIVERIIDAGWRTRRVNRQETAFLNDRTKNIQKEHGIQDPDEASVFLFTDPVETKRMSLFLRYRRSAERAYERALAEFKAARKERLELLMEEMWAKHSARLEAAKAEQRNAAQPQQTAAASPQNGFASQKPAKHDRPAKPRNRIGWR